MNHPGTICEQGLMLGFTKLHFFYSAPLTSTVIPYLCLGKLHQAGLSECVKMFMLSFLFVSVCLN